MDWHFSHRSLPELAGLSEADQDRVWRAARQRTPGWPSWVAGLTFLALLEIAEALWARIGPSVSGLRRERQVFVALAFSVFSQLWRVHETRPYLPMELPNHCRGCGYDLTANASGACPECGRTVAEPAEPPAPRLRVHAPTVAAVLLGTLVFLTFALLVSGVLYMCYR